MKLCPSARQFLIAILWIAVCAFSGCEVTGGSAPSKDYIRSLRNEADAIVVVVPNGKEKQTFADSTYVEREIEAEVKAVIHGRLHPRETLSLRLRTERSQEATPPVESIVFIREDHQHRNTWVILDGAIFPNSSAIRKMSTNQQINHR